MSAKADAEQLLTTLRVGSIGRNLAVMQDLVEIARRMHEHGDAGGLRVVATEVGRMASYIRSTLDELAWDDLAQNEGRDR